MRHLARGSKAGAAWEELDVIWFLQGNSMDSNLGSDTSDPARASSRIYVGNLKKHILREDLEKLFIKYGTIQGASEKPPKCTSSLVHKQGLRET